MKTKRVVNKKTGKVYEYPAERYNYKHKTTKGLTLVSSKGIEYKRNVEKFKARINENENFSEAYKLQLISDLDAYIDIYKNDGKKFTTTGFFGKIKDNKIEKMFANAGYTTADVAERLGVSEAYLLDVKNWTADGSDDVGSIFYIREKDENGNEKIISSYQFTFTYTGDILMEVD